LRIKMTWKKSICSRIQILGKENPAKQHMFYIEKSLNLK
jgi:hypothetical protein